jgi:hypothetical protein
MGLAILDPSWFTMTAADAKITDTTINNVFSMFCLVLKPSRLNFSPGPMVKPAGSPEII